MDWLSFFFIQKWNLIKSRWQTTHEEQSQHSVCVLAGALEGEMHLSMILETTLICSYDSTWPILYPISYPTQPDMFWRSLFLWNVASKTTTKFSIYTATMDQKNERFEPIIHPTECTTDVACVVLLTKWFIMTRLLSCIIFRGDARRDRVHTWVHLVSGRCKPKIISCAYLSKGK